MCKCSQDDDNQTSSECPSNRHYSQDHPHTGKKEKHEKTRNKGNTEKKGGKKRKKKKKKKKREKMKKKKGKKKKKKKKKKKENITRVDQI